VSVQVASSLSMEQPNDGIVANETYFLLWIILLLFADRVEKPVVVRVLMMITGDLLLARSLRVSLNVGVKKPTSISHVFDGDLRTNGDFKRAIGEVRSLKIGLEERTHLGVTRAAPVKDGEMGIKTGEVDDSWNQDQTKNTGNPMHGISSLGHLVVAKLIPEILDSIETNKGSYK